MSEVIINEVGPRDGLQNIENILSVNDRFELIKSLEAAGIKSLEIGSLVSEKAVPSMHGTVGTDTKNGKFRCIFNTCAKYLWV